MWLHKYVPTLFMANEQVMKKLLELMDDAEDKVLHLINNHKSKMIINMRLETDDTGTPEKLTVSLEKDTKQGTDPVTTEAERSAARKEINKLLRGLSQGVYLDVYDPDE